MVEKIQPASNRFVKTFHRPSNITSPTKHATHQDSDLENIFPSSLGSQHNGDHFFLRFGGLIHMDIGGHPPILNSNCPILTVFSSTRFSVMGTFLCNCGFFTYGAVLKPYTTSRWILVDDHLFQLDFFGNFHVNTSFCTFRVVLGIYTMFSGISTVKL
jgi:hypothetical protein